MELEVSRDSHGGRRGLWDGDGQGGRVTGGPCLSLTYAILSVTQLQMTLASVQELLLQQQQKVQELAHELATAKVPMSPSSPPPPVWQQ